jgi:hypothetical protein
VERDVITWRPEGAGEQLRVEIAQLFQPI